jgi:hypothetical protein
MGGERIIEMTWRCSSCQRQNLGRHKSCQGCGNPKDASEEFEMPSDTALVPTVTDEGLLRMATAGPDWRCRFCGGDQRRSDQSCANCGAGAAETTAPIRTAASVFRKPVSVGAVLLWMVAIGGCSIWALKWYANRPYVATVSAVAWEHVIDVERYALRSHEGFKETIPAGAVNVKRLERRLHHHEQVVSGYTTQSYVVQVADGFSLERYTDREACGEDCTTEPKTCREVCRPNENGFATCREVCSGGGRKCRTRYCSVTKTRQVPKTRGVTRTKQVPVYQSVPRYADAFSYQAWSWAPERTVRESGKDANRMRWPAGARTAGLARGEQERERRTANYVVTLKYQTDSTVRFEVKNPDLALRYRVGSQHELSRASGVWTIHGAALATLP